MRRIISKPCNLTWFAYKTEVAIQSGNSIGAEIGSEARSKLRMMVALDEEKAARSFGSSVPHFVRIMRKFNISGSYTLVSNIFSISPFDI